MDPQPARFTVEAAQQGKTLAALLRVWLPGFTWSQVHRLVETRRVKINDELWLDPARRLRVGDVVDIGRRPSPKPQLLDSIVIRHIDEHIIVVEKPAGIPTVRHPAERGWEKERRILVPTLDDLVLHQVGAVFPKRGQGSKPRLRVVQRLDKETSGLVVFARTAQAERGLGMQFAKHVVVRRYLALVPGVVEAQVLRSFLVRDRGDGRRGSSPVPNVGKEAITHISVAERFPAFTLLSCRLETGRTHQIRIHLAELGHPVCGEKVYNRKPNGEPIANWEGCPRLFLHAVELGFQHPLTAEAMHWDMPLPEDLRLFLETVRGK
ncbi:MAG: RluA family pseudouridine synthase [Gemmataceae bacterium]